MAGVGLEYAFADNWSAKIEYDFIGLGDRSFLVPGVLIPALAGDTITSDHNISLVKVGLNFRFGAFGTGPAGMRY
jgi:outer membrane immunogenic protein